MLTRHKKVEVVTIGAGWTAAVMAWKLGSAGHRVVSLEQGPVRWANPDFQHNHDYLRFAIRQAMMFDLSQETWTWRPNAKLPSLPIRQYGAFHVGRGLGGSSAHWTAQFWRFVSADFQHRSHNIARYGKKKIPDNMTIQDWPLTYEELEPYYDAVEYDIGASGQAGNIAWQKIEGGDPFEEPRSRGYPLPPHPRTIYGKLFGKACRELGYHPFPQPAGIISQAYRDLSGRTRSGCIYCGKCTRFGCEVDAKSSAITTHIPAALATGKYEVRTECKVTGINVGPDGLATGVTYVDLLTGEEHEQPADIVMLTAYTLTNVRMLLLSKSKKHPDGIGNAHGMVGKNYTYQLLQYPATCIYEGRRFNTFVGNGVIYDVINDFNADNFDHSNLDFIGGSNIKAGGGEQDPLTATGMPSLKAGTPAATMSKPPNVVATSGELGSLAHSGKEWGKDLKENLRRNWDGNFGINMEGEIQAYKMNFLDLDPTYKDAWNQPLLRLTFDFYDNEKNLYHYTAKKIHEMAKQMNPDRIAFTGELKPFNVHQYQSTHCTGGAIMGSGPGNSVTNKYGQVWDTPNVFVTGAALYPQNPGKNPTETLLALAYMVGDAIRDKYFRHPEEIIT